jgi:hypothetical protein
VLLKIYVRSSRLVCAKDIVRRKGDAIVLARGGIAMVPFNELISTYFAETTEDEMILHVSANRISILPYLFCAVFGRNCAKVFWLRKKIVGRRAPDRGPSTLLSSAQTVRGVVHNESLFCDRSSMVCMKRGGEKERLALVDGSSMRESHALNERRKQFAIKKCHDALSQGSKAKRGQVFRSTKNYQKR